MCGIVGCLSKEPVAPLLLESLISLEYRGHDSAGIATLEEDKVWCRKGVGAVADVDNKYALYRLPGNVGIGHVRWATHGRVSQENAHPHLDCRGEIAVVHNGIIRNFQSLRHSLEGKHRFVSDTDTEVISHLIEEYLEDDLESAVLKALSFLEGSYALAIISSREPGKIIVAKNESPLLVGQGHQKYFVASDLICMAGQADRVLYLDDGEIAIVRQEGVTVFDKGGQEVPKTLRPVTCQWQAPSKNGHRYYMLKEMMEEPEAVENALQQDNQILLDTASEILQAKQVVLTACGTSRHAALVGRYLFASLAGKFSEVVMASEFENFANFVSKDTLLIAISQSGETADVISGVKIAKERGARVLSLVNVPESTLARISDRTIYMNCGPELCVAATKSFTAQLVIFYLLAFSMINRLQDGKRELLDVADRIRKSLDINKERMKTLAAKITDKTDFYYLARGANFAIALEGALKMKEVSYIHAEGMPAGELKHGTLALIQDGTPVLIICPHDDVYYDTLSNTMEVKARGAFVIGLSDEDCDFFDEWIEIPHVEPIFYPLVSVIPLQLLAYYVATSRGRNPDRPRNLAKSVTVK